MKNANLPDGICRLKRNSEKRKEGYLPALLDEWDRVRLAILRKGQGMRAIIEILLACAAMVGAAAWLLNRPPPDPEEDAEQERYLTEWNHKHGKGKKQ